MSYCTITDVYAYMSQQDVLAASDDTSTGDPNNAAVLSVQAGILDMASADIDGRIANIYDVPLSPVPPIARTAAAIFAAEALYARRYTPDEKNPFKERADVWRDRLEKIGAGKLNLDLRYPRDFPQGTVIQCPIAMNVNSL